MNIYRLSDIPDHLKDYFTPAEIGLEETPEEYIDKLVAVFREVKRVLKDDGTLWVVIADSYAGSGKGGGKKENTIQNTHDCSRLGNRYGKSEDEIARQKKANVTSKTFEGIKAKDLIGIPWMLAFALQAEGWYLRQDIIWSKPNPMPESVKDRFCKSHEHIFFFTKSGKYYFNHNAALEPAVSFYDSDREVTYTHIGINRQFVDNDKACPKRGYINKDGETGLSEQHHGKNIPTNPLRTKRDVWVVASEPSDIGHFAMFPQKLIMPCILCGCPENGIVLDPFLGSGTTAIVAVKNLRKYIGCEINPEYVRIAEQRIANEKGLFNE